MNVINLQQAIKASLYERVSSPFFGCFVISWCIINYGMVARVLFGEYDIESKINIISNASSNYFSFVGKPLLFSVLFIIFNPLLSILVFYWQELVRDKKRDIKNRIEKGTMVKLDDYKKLEGEYSDKLSSYNSKIVSYDRKIEDLNAKNIEIISDYNNLHSEHESLKKRVIGYSKLKQEHEEFKINHSELELELNKRIKKVEELEEINNVLNKQLENVDIYFIHTGQKLDDKMIILDIPHLKEHSIGRLVHEIKELGFFPIFDGDARAIKLMIPFYVDTTKVEELSDKYRAESSYEASNVLKMDY
ncbi:hypothetical protein HUO09_05600 [Vibrio sp. Y2-5]|uniref:hypothetical protein n=1 Tax=Vibrio sp. Y2-5 TaxID=2743977 RepID=UPI001660C52B|nr:hypothetical protein [Vibrio sp. Y2-5]MBD0785807.1 hypothetical protein [Vibrio sp. Y2-5]